MILTANIRHMAMYSDAVKNSFNNWKHRKRSMRQWVHCFTDCTLHWEQKCIQKQHTIWYTSAIISVKKKVKTNCTNCAILCVVQTALPLWVFPNFPPCQNNFTTCLINFPTYKGIQKKRAKIIFPPAKKNFPPASSIFLLANEFRKKSEKMSPTRGPERLFRCSDVDDKSKGIALKCGKWEKMSNLSLILNFTPKKNLLICNSCDFYLRITWQLQRKSRVTILT